MPFASVRRPNGLKGLVGIDVRGFRHSVSNQAIRHSQVKHGEHGTELARGQKPITDADFLRLPAIIKAGRYEPATPRAFGPPRFVIEADVGGDHYTYVGEVRRGKGRLDMISLWKR